MKHKGIVVLPLALLLTVSAMSATAFAETPEKSISAETTEKETTQENTLQDQDQEKVKDAAKASGENRPKCSRGRKHGAKEEVAEPEGAIGKDAAKEKALSDAGITSDQAGKVRSHVSKLDDGTVVYKVHFTCDGKHYSYQINATTGKVVDKSSRAVTEDTAKRSGKTGKTAKENADS